MTPHHYNSDIHHRHSIRLKDYDYFQNGMYFVTVCAQKKECLFGNILNGKMELNEYGKIVVDEWFQTPKIRNEIELDEWVVMPNHFHAIVFIINDCRGDRPVAPTTIPCEPQPKSIGSLMAGFKSAVTKRINQLRTNPGVPVWQRNYFEHVVRNEKSLGKIREYVVNNPFNWETDEFFSKNPCILI